jgi:hypothetical protein
MSHRQYNTLCEGMSYYIEVYEHGWLMCSPPRKRGVPMAALSDALPLFPKGSVMEAGIAGAMGAVMAIGRPRDLDKWKKEITDELASGGLDVQTQWIRGVDCGMSSMALFAVLTTNSRGECLERAGGNIEPPKHTPKDADDFGRCYRMVKFCGFNVQIAGAPNVQDAVGKISVQWDMILGQWEALCAAYESKQNETVSRILHDIEKQ